MNHYRRFLVLATLIAGLSYSGQAAAEKAGFVGMQIQGMSPKIAEAMGRNTPDGVLVRDVALGGPADKAGFQRGDLIVEFAGTTVTAFEDLVSGAKKLKVSDKAKAKVIRHGASVELTLVAGSWPQAWRVTKNSFATVGPAGITLASLSEKIRKRFGLRWGSTGVVVTIIDDLIAPNLDLKQGDIIYQINQQPVWKPLEASSILMNIQKAQKKTALLLVEGTDGFRFVILPLQPAKVGQ